MGTIDALGHLAIVPADGAHLFGNPTWLALGPDGNMWVGDGRVGVVKPDGTWSDKTLPLGGSAGDVASRLSPDPGGKVWYAGTGRVGSMDTTTFQVTEFVLPWAPTGVAVAADGTVWTLGNSGGFGQPANAIIKIEH